MTDAGPDEYDREYINPLSDVTRVRLGYSHNRGTVTRFVVQLEYRVEDEWREVVRYDHDPAGEFGHDVTKEGLHIDSYRDGKQYRTEYIGPPMPAGRALDRAEDHLTNNLKVFINRFEQWHGIRNR